MRARITSAMQGTWWFAVAMALLGLSFEAINSGVVGLNVFVAVGFAGWAYIPFFLLIDGLISWVRKSRSGSSVSGFGNRALGYLLWSATLSLLGAAAVALAVITQ